MPGFNTPLKSLETSGMLGSLNHQGARLGRWSRSAGQLVGEILARLAPSFSGACRAG